MSVVVVCDGLRLVREAVVKAVGTVPGVTRVDEAATTGELLSRVRLTGARVALVDVDIFGALAAAAQLSEDPDGPAVLVLASRPDRETAALVLAAGANAYLTKDMDSVALAAAVEHALVHGRSENRPGPKRSTVALKAASATMRSPFNLSEREQQVLTGMSEGKSNHQIGRDLYLSEDTIKTHARRLFRKMSVGDRAHAVAVGFRRGLIH